MRTSNCNATLNTTIRLQSQKRHHGFHQPTKFMDSISSAPTPASLSKKCLPPIQTPKTTNRLRVPVLDFRVRVQTPPMGSNRVPKTSVSALPQLPVLGSPNMRRKTLVPNPSSCLSFSTLVIRHKSASTCRSKSPMLLCAQYQNSKLRLLLDDEDYGALVCSDLEFKLKYETNH